MATLAQFRTKVSQKLGLDNTSGSVEQQAIDSWVNEGVIDVLMETQVYVTESTAALTGGSGDYILDPSILLIKDIFATSTGRNYSLTHVSPDEIIQRRSVSSISFGPARLYALNGAQNLMVYPTPATGDTLTFWYVPRPTALANPTDDPSNTAYGGIPPEWHKAVELYALWQGGDYADDSTSQNGALYRQDYEGWLKRVKKERTYKGGRLLGVITPGRRKRPYAPHDPSTDTGYYYS